MTAKLKGPGVPRARPGRKPHPTLKTGPITEAAKRRFLVATAAHNARWAYHQRKGIGKPISWEVAITNAVQAVAHHKRADGGDLVTFAAVERQVFPRAADQKKV